MEKDLVVLSLLLVLNTSKLNRTCHNLWDPFSLDFVHWRTWERCREGGVNGGALRSICRLLLSGGGVQYI